MHGLVLTAALQLVPVAAAHEGSVHAGVPHRILLAGVVLGGGILAGSLYLARHGWADRPRRTLTSVFVGLSVAALNTIGLIEIQVEPTTGTLLFREWYPVIALVAGVSIMLGSLMLGLRRSPYRPIYTLLGVLLGLWVGYPVLIGLSGGYCAVTIVPVPLLACLAGGYLIVTAQYGIAIGLTVTAFGIAYWVYQQWTADECAIPTIVISRSFYSLALLDGEKTPEGDALRLMTEEDFWLLL